MSVTEFFKYLGAPVANQQWSWGSLRPEDGTVFLKVWQHEKLIVNDRTLRASSAQPMTGRLGLQHQPVLTSLAELERPAVDRVKWLLAASNGLWPSWRCS